MELRLSYQLVLFIVLQATSTARRLSPKTRTQWPSQLQRVISNSSVRAAYDTDALNDAYLSGMAGLDIGVNLTDKMFRGRTAQSQ